MAEKKLQVKNLKVSFRTQAGILKAVRDISFDLYAGETLAIVGESGSGKSVTSKAIIGILSGNSIVEGGEILYDGQDLLKIDEENFHKIRGDKIAMIFQDPLSSLNPIMRVGKQLTEAMILNGKARQKNSRKEFNTHLKLLNYHLDQVNGDKEGNKAICKTFNEFSIVATKLEKAYNDALAASITLKTEADETIFLVEKRQKVNIKSQISKFAKMIKETVHNYVVLPKEAEEINANIQKALESFKSKKNEEITEQGIALFTQISKLMEEASKRPHPNFFTLGYYKYVHPEFDETSLSIKELDEMTEEALNKEFLNNFIALGTTGMEHSRQETLQLKRELLPKLDALIDTLSNIENLKKKDIMPQLKEVKKLVKAAIDGCRVVKHSVEYSFDISIQHEIDRYFEGIKNNPKNLRKYERSKAKFDKLVEKGKSPTWKVIPPYLVDLELTKSNIIKIIEDVKVRYNKDLNKTNHSSELEMNILLRFFKEQASRLVYKVTKGIAKTRSLELLKEVGIPEPNIRYKQYPFEFSGGMRQRIVIAIALSANPDILICDEPTTALDVTIQSQILELINKIKEERHLSVIFITHDLGVVANMADRIAVMYAGKIVEYGTSEDVFYDPRHPYTWALLASMPDLETKEKLEAIPGTPPNMIYPPVGDAFAERNKYAMEIDFEMEPPLFQISDTHYAATWLLHPSAPKVEPPKIIRERIERMKKEAEDYGK